MEEYCRPATLEDLKTLIRALNQQGASYLLIGGYALFAHGYHRATTDIDLLVPATQESGQLVREALMVLPDQAAKDLDPTWFEEGENIRIANAFVVDIMLNACGETYETLEQYAETVELDGIPIRTINLEGLLRTKQTMRDKDMAGDGLVRAICLALTRKVGRLTGVEMRYIRSSGFLMSQPSLGKLLGIDGQTVARWEKSGKVPKWADKLVRLLYTAHADGHETIQAVVDRINDVDRLVNQCITLETTVHGWVTEVREEAEAA